MIGGSAGAVDVARGAEAARRRARRPARPVCRLDRGARGRRPDAAGMRSKAPTRSRSSGGSGRRAASTARAILAEPRAARPRRRRERRRLRLLLARRRRRRPRPAPGPRTVTQVYRAPYLAHATMEPINCTARVADGKVEVWVPTQVPGLARAIAAQVAGVPQDAVTVHVTYLGGGFGRRLDVDFVGQAVRIAVEMRRPAGAAGVVARGGPRRTTSIGPAARRGAARHPRRRRPADRAARSPAPATRSRRAGSSAACRASPARSTRPTRPTSEGLFDQLYEIPQPAHRPRRDAERRAGRLLALGRPLAQRLLQRVVHRRARARRPAGSGRLPAGAAEGLAAAPRRAAARRASRPAGRATARPRPLAPGRARGVALHESFGSIVAQVVEVSIVDGRAARAPGRLRRRRRHRRQPGHRRPAARERGDLRASAPRSTVASTSSAASSSRPTSRAIRWFASPMRRGSRPTWWQHASRRAASARSARRRWRRRWPTRCSRSPASACASCRSTA